MIEPVDGETLVERSRTAQFRLSAAVTDTEAAFDIPYPLGSRP